MGAEIRTYLLESCRVVGFSPGERTYHVFYELLFGASDTKTRFKGLEPERKYRLLYHHSSDGNDHEPEITPMPEFRRDKENFEILDKGLDGIGFTSDERERIYRALAGLIFLGEVKLVTVQDKQGQDVCAVEKTTKTDLETGAELLGFPAEKLTELLQIRWMVIKRKEAGVEKSESYTVPRTAEQGQATLQSLVKMLYKRIFDLVTEKINSSLHGGEGQKKARQIGVLDIYGFECLQSNSFEQLCINLANERLQQFFIERVLLSEQTLYTKEGLVWEDIPLPSADPVLKTIATVFNILDDHNMRLTRNQPTNDEKFTEECHRKLGLGGIFLEARKSKKLPMKTAKSAPALRPQHGFLINHYAGEVTYQTTDFWLEKNNSKLVGDAEVLIRDSTCTLVSRCSDKTACLLGGSSFTSVARKYLRDLDVLMKTLGECSLHYIRTFKPNVQQKATKWQGGVMLEQMRQSGTVELVRIMHDGYPHRCPFQDLATKFEPIKDQLPAEFRSLDPRTFVEALMRAFSEELRLKDWTIGTTKLFLKAGKLAVLEKLSQSEDAISGEIIEKLKGYIRRKKLRRCLTAVKICCYLPKLMRRTRSDALGASLVKSVRIYVRLMRHHIRIRRRKAVNKLVPMLHTIVPQYLATYRWLNRARDMIKKKRIANSHYDTVIQKSVFQMWWDIATEERRKREEEARLEAEQRRKDEELERAYEEMMARKRAKTEKNSGTNVGQVTSDRSATKSTGVLITTTDSAVSSIGNNGGMDVDETENANKTSQEVLVSSTVTPESVTTTVSSSSAADHAKISFSAAGSSTTSTSSTSQNPANGDVLQELSRLRAENQELKQQNRAGFRGNSRRITSIALTRPEHLKGIGGVGGAPTDKSDIKNMLLSSFPASKNSSKSTLYGASTGVDSISDEVFTASGSSTVTTDQSSNCIHGPSDTMASLSSSASSSFLKLQTPRRHTGTSTAVNVGPGSGKAITGPGQLSQADHLTTTSYTGSGLSSDAGGAAGGGFSTHDLSMSRSARRRSMGGGGLRPGTTGLGLDGRAITSSCQGGPGSLNAAAATSGSNTNAAALSLLAPFHQTEGDKLLIARNQMQAAQRREKQGWSLQRKLLEDNI